MIGADKAVLIREVNQALGRESLGGRTQLGSPGWYWIMCPQCKSELRYELVYEIPYYYPPVKPLSCPVCNADLGVSGNQVMVLKAEPWPPALPPTYTCPHCGAMFKSQSELNFHIVTDHAPPPPPVFGFKEWLKKNWPYVLGGTLAITAVAIVASR